MKVEELSWTMRRNCVNCASRRLAGTVELTARLPIHSGALRGLETWLQLVTFDEVTDTLQIMRKVCNIKLFQVT